MAWLFLPENEQVQYLQKIALRAENPYGPRQYGFAVFSALAIFAAIEAAHFPAVGTAIDASASAIFTFFYIPFLFAKWQWELHRKIYKNIGYPPLKITLLNIGRAGCFASTIDYALV